MKKHLLIYSSLLFSITLNAQVNVATESKDTLTQVANALADAFADSPDAPKMEVVNVPAKTEAKANAVAVDDDDDDEEQVDTTRLTRKNRVKEAFTKDGKTYFNGLDYLLNRRYTPFDADEQSKGFWKNIWIEGGIGIEKATTGVDDYTFGPMTSLYAGIGKHFSEKHAARVKLFGGYVYRNEKDWFMYKLGLKADYLYDFSSHFSGYKVDRRWSFASVLGLGATYSKYDDNYGRGKQASKMNWEGRMGIQVKAYTGPQGLIALEPYVGFASNVVTDNWRGFNTIYGANLSYIYYLENRLSKEKRKKLIDERDLIDEVAPDSTLHSWRKPWFLEVSNSLNMGGSEYLGSTANMGMGWTVSFGQWITTALGVRASFASENFANNEIQMPNDRTLYEGCNTFEVRMEGILNPFGLKKNYNWESPYGAYLIAGIKAGAMWQGSEYSRYSVPYAHYYHPKYLGFSFGAHAWVRLADGLQAFIEPRYEMNNYHDKYYYLYGQTVDDRNKRINGNIFSLQIGLTVTSKSRDRIDWTREEEADYTDLMKKITIGAGAGFNYLPYRYRYNGSKAFGYNLQGFAEYHFNSYHSARLEAHWMENPSMILKNNSFFECKHSDVKASLSYMLNLTNAMGRINPDGRKFETFIFAGPTVCFLMRNDEIVWKPMITAHGGIKFLYNINQNLGVHLTPTFYFLTKKMKDDTNSESIYYGLPTRAISLVEALNIGVQYSF